MIGGEYYFQQPSAVSKNLAKELNANFQSLSFFSTGRDALFSLFSDLKVDRIWLPDYLCHSIFIAAKQSGKIICFYEVDKSLKASQGWIDKIRTNDAVLAIHFFGIPDDEFLKNIQGRGAVLISDVTHLMLNEVGLSNIIDISDYSVSSLRKLGPFPDGAFCGSNVLKAPIPSSICREEFWTLRAAAMCSRGFSALYKFSSDENFFLFCKAESLLECEPADRYGMSFLSQNLLAIIDIDLERNLVAKNSQILFSRLEKFCELPSHGKGFSQFVVCNFNEKALRDRIREALGAQQIFCPVHWDTSFLERSNPLSDELLSIPCDARYKVDDMHKIADVLIASL